MQFTLWKQMSPHPHFFFFLILLFLREKKKKNMNKKKKNLFNIYTSIFSLRADLARLH